MSFTDKFEKLTKDHPVVRNINKQLKKRNVTVKANWWKDFKASELMMTRVKFISLLCFTQLLKNLLLLVHTVMILMNLI